jgi:hypothetical protein
VRLAVAKNPNTEAKTIRKLSRDHDREVSRRAKEHPSWSEPSFWDKLMG